MKSASDTKKKGMKLLAKALNGMAGFPFATKYSGLGTILMLHRVLPTIDEKRIWSNSFLEVTTDYFENTILYYKKHNYEFISLDEFISRLKSGKSQKRKYIHYTFDDGYKDNLDHALPILKKHNVPATIYITNDFPNKKAVLWWYGIEDYLLLNDAVNFDFNNEHYSLSTATVNKKNEAFSIIHHLIQNTDFKTLQERVDIIFDQFYLDKMSYVESVAMDWDDIRTLNADPLITIGAHTITHPNLGQLDKKEIHNEIFDSKAELERQLNTKINHFAYPFGGKEQVNREVINILNKSGCTTAVTTFSANVVMECNKHLFELPRIAVGMSMDQHTLDLIRHGFIPFVRNKGRKIILSDN